MQSTGVTPCVSSTFRGKLCNWATHPTCKACKDRVKFQERATWECRMKNRVLVMWALPTGLALSLSAQQNPPPDTSSSVQTTQHPTSTDRYGNPVPATDNPQNQNPNNPDAQTNDQTPVYRVTVVQRT